jgi:hypothetical protein
MEESAMSEHVRVTEATVRQLAEVAALPLPGGRAAVVAATLAAWLPMANELSRKMAEADHLALTPITRFAHPVAAGGASPWR